MELNLIVVSLLALPIYLLPALIARSREHRDVWAIFALNLLLGWTLIGWLVALIWAIPREAEAEATAPVDGSTGHGGKDWPTISGTFPLWLVLPVSALFLVAIIYLALSGVSSYRTDQKYGSLSPDLVAQLKLLEQQAQQLEAILGNSTQNNFENLTEQFFAWFEESPLGTSILLSLALALVGALLSIPVLLWRNGRQLAKLNVMQRSPPPQA